jgi:hypothetical protein
MRSAPTVSRSLIGVLMRLAAAAFPIDRNEWAAAMRAELGHMDNDREALSWALGCLCAGLCERCRVGALLNLRAVRWAIALWIMCQVAGNLCTSCLVLSYKIPYLEVTRFMSLCGGASDYRLLIPVLDATATWEPCLCLIGGAVYVFGIITILRRHRHAYLLLAAALLLDLGLWLYELDKPLFLQIYSSTDFMHDALSYAISASLVWALWQGCRAQREAAP